MSELGTAESLWIKRIDVDDARRETDALSTLEERIKVHEPYYPNIAHWVTQKVVPDLKTGRRLAYVGFHGAVPIMAAVLKRGTSTKFCHLSIDAGFQDMKLGHLIFALMAADVRHMASEIHFTLPESLWEREKGFFGTFGFTSVDVASHQYRLFDEELRCSTSFTEVWRNVVAQLPTLLTSAPVAGYWVNDGVVLSIKEKYADAVMRGEKKVELRRRFADRWVGRNASVYCAGGSGTLLGTISIQAVTKASPEDIWSRFAADLHCSRVEFDAYVGQRSFVYAIELSEPRPYRSPLPLSQLSHLLGKTLRPPQSYAKHTASDTWGEALSIAAILHGSFAPSL